MHQPAERFKNSPANLRSLVRGAASWPVLLLLVALQPAQAANISYRYFDAGYSHTDIGPADGNGGYIVGSWRFDDHWFVLGHYSENNLRSSDAPSRADFEAIRGGVGYRDAVPGWLRTDWYALATYNEINLSEFEDESESGEDFEFGIRHRWRPQIIVEVAARYFNSDIDLLAGKTGVKFGAQWEITRLIGVSFGYEDIDRFSEWRIGLRKYW